MNGITRFLVIVLCAVAIPALSKPVFAAGEIVHKTEPAIRYLPREAITIQTKAGQDYIFDVEMATEPDQQTRGLMYRTHLNNDSGMLFLFNDEAHRSFWMRNTLIPLDMIFISRDGTIMHIHHNAIPQDETMITSEGDAMAVLEINGGMAGTLAIKEGDRVIHPAFRNVVAP